jgi:hypothetical protein
MVGHFGEIRCVAGEDQARHSRWSGRRTEEYETRNKAAEGCDDERDDGATDVMQAVQVLYFVTHPSLRRSVCSEKWGTYCIVVG